ncbi:MAG: hypothetical protein VX367_00175 [SAR324 cluster bacterium]|nr:hypothetical protein [SAR324 cluster bacterium]
MGNEIAGKQGWIHGYPSRVRVGRGGYLRSPDHLGRSSEAKDRKNPKKVKCDRRTDRRTDGPTDRRTDKAGCRVA